MKQSYHSNATTNIHIREQIKSNSNLRQDELAQRFGISRQTVSKWNLRESPVDQSCAPHNIIYALNEIQTAMIQSIRTSTWLSLDEIWEMMLVSDERVSRSSIYRCLKRNGINRLPFEHREKAKKFKEYIPGFLHIDVTYLPKLEGSAAYLFVAIDRATRLMFYKVYDKKTAESTVDFMNEVLSFYPFIITHILTDNGHEFSNLLYRSKKGNKASNPSKLDEICKLNDIDHRLTKPATPKTNGMVERVNGTIKNNTILKKEYVNKDNMVKDLMDFLCNYNLYRRHGSLRRELKVKTPIQALNKWYEINPEIFIRNPNNTENYLLNLQRRNNLKNQ